MSTGKTYSTKYLLDSNNNRGAEGQVLSTTSTGIDWVDANTVPGTGLWLADGNNIYNSNSGNVGIGVTGPSYKLDVNGDVRASNLRSNSIIGGTSLVLSTSGGANIELYGAGSAYYDAVSHVFRSADASSTAMQINTSTGNVGIGTTNPTKTLDVEGSIRAINTGGTVAAEIDAASGSTWRFRSNPTAGTNSYGLDIVKGGAGTDVKMSITSAGNVGIGTTSPTSKLHVVGTGRSFSVTSTNDQVPASIKSTNSTGISMLGFQATGSTSDYHVRVGANTTNFVAYTSNAERMRITSAGNVGIGTTSPQKKLDVYLGTSDAVASIGGTISSGEYAGLHFGYSETGNSLYRHSAIVFERDDAAFGDARGKIHILNSPSGSASADLSDSRLTVLPTGNVGIGTTSPDVRLEVVEASPTNGIVADFVNSTNAGGTTAAIKLSNADSEACDVILGANRVGANFGSDFFISLSDSVDGSNQERFRITEAGNVGIGTTSPLGKLHVKNVGEIYTSLAGSDSAVNFVEAAGNPWRIGNRAADDSFRFSQDSSSLGTNVRVTFADGGNVGIGTTSPNNLLNLQKNVAGGDVAIYIQNNNSVVGSTDETTSLKFAHGNDGVIGYEAAKIVGGKEGDFETSTANVKGFLSFSTASGTSLDPSVNNIERMRITGSGNVGIGTTSPDSRLDINAGVSAITSGPAVRISKGASPVGLIRYDTLVIEANDVPTIRLGESDGTVSSIMSGDSNLRINSTHPIKFYTNGTATGEAHAGQGGTFAMIIDNSQNVGIGTTNPATRLHVFKENTTSRTTTTDLITLGSAHQSVGYNGFGTAIVDYRRTYQHSNPHVINRIKFIERGDSGNDWGGAIQFETKTLSSGTAAPVTRMSIDYNGNVGIGTTNPGAKLEVVQGAGGTAQNIINAGETGFRFSTKVEDTTVNTPVFRQGIYHNNTENATIAFYRGGSSVGGFMTFQTYNGNERMRIESGGNVGIGTTNPDYKLEVDGTLGVSRTDGIIFAGSTANGNKITVDTSNDFIFSTSLNSAPYTVTERMRIANNGATTFTSTVTATNFILSSDERLKENIEEVCDNRIKADWKTFELKTEKGQKRYGVIAQELEKTNPEFVREDTQGFKSVAYIDLLIAKIAELEARLEKAGI